MTSGMSERYRRRSPPKYRRHLSSVEIGYTEPRDVPETHRPLSAREGSALDKRWLHRSLGDLTQDPEVTRTTQPSHFLSDLQLRYPEAFHRRNKSREASRKLFDAGLHVRFEDEVRFASQPDLTTIKSASLKHLASWETEFGHFQGQRSRSRDYLATSDLDENHVLGSNCRSHTLNRILYEESPLRKRFEQDRRHDRSIEGEESFQDYFLGRSKERSNNKRFRQRRVLQRKIDNKANGAIEDSETSNSSYPPNKRKNHQYLSSTAILPKSRGSFSYRSIDIDTLLANTDIIDTLLEKMNQKVLGPAFPPDSAIDVETPSVQSLATSDQGGNSKHSLSVQQELQSLDSKRKERERTQTDSESSPGSSASSYARKNSTCHKDTHETQSGANSDTMNANSLTTESCHGGGRSHSGLLQLCTDAVTEEDPGITCTLPGNDSLHVVESRTGQPGMGVSRDYSDTAHVSCDTEKFCMSDAHVTAVDKNGDMGVNSVNIEGADSVVREKDSVDSVSPSRVVSSGSEMKESAKNAGYSADDEDDSQITVVEAGGYHSNISEEKLFSHRDSDVDSGVGHSSIGTESRCSTKISYSIPRDITHKSMPVKPDHSILPSRSDVYRVNEQPLVNGLSEHRGDHSDTDDIEVHQGLFHQSNEDTTLTDGYRPMPSTTPGLLSAQRQASPRFRPKSAPLFTLPSQMLKNVEDPTYLATDANSTSGRRSREKARKPAPVKPNHTIVPLRSGTQDRVTLTHSNSLEEVDDTDIALGVAQPTEAELRIAEKYRRTRSPLPFSLKNQGQVTPRYRPQSAPLFVPAGDMQFGLVNISLSNDSLSDLSSGLSCSDKGSVSDRSPSHKCHTLPNMRKNTTQSYQGILRKSDSESIMRNEFQNVRTPHKQRNSIGSSVESEESYNSQDSRDIDDLEESTNDDAEQHSAGTVERARIGPYFDETNVKGTNSSILQHSFDNEEEDGVSESRGLYKPVVSSPRMQEKRLRLKNILKNKKGSFSPAEESSVNQQVINGSNVKRIYAKDRSSVTEPALTQNISDTNHHGDHPRETTGSQPSAVNDRLAHPDSDSTNRLSVWPQTSSLAINNAATTPSKSPAKIPPAKPARAKRKNLPSDLNLSKYKIKPGEANPSVTYPPDGTFVNSNYPGGNQRSPNTNIREITPAVRPHSSNGVGERPASSASGMSTIDTDIVEIPSASQPSNLEKSRHLSASKVSLLDKMGDLKSATKHKFKAMRKAMSLERGIDSCGVEQNPTGQKSSGSGFPKMKKAPSLKSITSLFKGKKKKKGKLYMDDYQANEAGNLSKSKQWASCHTLSPSSSAPQQPPPGRLLKVNQDGTYMVQLHKPHNGPIGFYIAKGNAKFGNGIFVSRFSPDRPEHLFAGLISVGDEIIEINDHFVRDLTLDAVYKLIGGQAAIMLKIFPLIARKDI